MAQEIDELTAEINEMRLGPPPEHPQAGWMEVRSRTSQQRGDGASATGREPLEPRA
jgi:hypothetical protein